MIISISKAIYEAKAAYVENQKKEPQNVIMSKVLFSALKMQNEEEIDLDYPVAHEMKILSTEELNDFEFKLF